MAVTNATLFIECGSDGFARLWQDVCLGPFVTFKPGAIARGWMRQRQELRQIFRCPAHGLRQRIRRGARQIRPLGMAADQQCQPNFRHRRQQPDMPERRAFRPRSAIAALGRAGIAKPHRQMCDRSGVEFIAVQPKPAAQPIARRIVPNDATQMNAARRRLPNQQNARLPAQVNDGLGAERQVLFADTALPDVSKQRRKRCHELPKRQPARPPVLIKFSFTTESE